MLRQTILLVLLATGWAQGEKGMNSRFKPAIYDNDMTASSIRESKASNYQNLQSLDDQVQREGGAAPISSGADYGYETDGAADSYQPTYQAQGYGYDDSTLMLPQWRVPLVASSWPGAPASDDGGSTLNGLQNRQSADGRLSLSSMLAGVDRSAAAFSRRSNLDEDPPLGGSSLAGSLGGSYSSFGAGTSLGVSGLNRRDDYGLNAYSSSPSLYGASSYDNPSYGSSYSTPYSSSYGGSSYGSSYSSPYSYGSSYANPLSYSSGGYGSGYGGGYSSLLRPNKFYKPDMFNWIKKHKFNKFNKWNKFPSQLAYGGGMQNYAGYYPSNNYPLNPYYEPSIFDMGKYLIKGVFKGIFKPVEWVFDWALGPFVYDYPETDKLDHFLKAIAVFLPIGVFLSAIVPNIVTISTGRRKRSLETNSIGDDSFDPQVTFPILDMISKYGMKALQDPNCQAKFACEMGTMGGLPEANGIQRALWMGAQFVPDHMARSVGADKLVRSIRSRQCTDYACQ